MIELEDPPKRDRQAARTEQRFALETDRWDLIYSDHAPWPVRMWDRHARRNVRERFRRTFEIAGPLAGSSVLDLGCGSGRYLVEAARRGASRIIGVDLAAPMIERAARLVRTFDAADRVELRVADLFELELSERFDLVIANGVFDYLADSAGALARMRGLTRGTCVASFPDRAALRALPRRLFWRMRGLEIALFDEPGILAFARVAGFASARVERMGPIFLLVARNDSAGA
jgi:SAM-dependent methyltransferase